MREFFFCAATNNRNFDRMSGNPICIQIPWDNNALALAKWANVSLSHLKSRVGFRSEYYQKNLWSCDDENDGCLTPHFGFFREKLDFRLSMPLWPNSVRKVGFINWHATPSRAFLPAVTCGSRGRKERRYFSTNPTDPLPIHFFENTIDPRRLFPKNRLMHLEDRWNPWRVAQHLFLDFLLVTGHLENVWHPTVWQHHENAKPILTNPLID